MKNTKKMDNKKGKKIETKDIKPPPLVFTQINSASSCNRQAVLNSILSPSKKKSIKVFTPDQQKIIQDQFTKMVKKLKRKLISPQKTQISPRNKIQSKTQRFQFIDPNSCSKQTIKKSNKTERKVNNTKSPKAHSKINNKEEVTIFPLNKINKINSLQFESPNCRKNQRLQSPKKIIKKLIEKNAEKKNNKKQIKRQIKRKTLKSNESIAESYLLFEDKFIQMDINQEQLKQFQYQILQQSAFHQNQQLDIQLKQVLFFQQKQKQKDKFQIDNKKIINDQIIDYSSYNGMIGNKPSKNQNIQNNSLIERKRPQNKNHITKRILKDNQLFQQFYDEAIHKKSQNQNFPQKDYHLSNIQLKQEKIPQNQVSNPTQGYSSQFISSQNQIHMESAPFQSQCIKFPSAQSPIYARISAINLQLNKNKQILKHLLDTKRIDNVQYQKYMDSIIQIYDQQMMEANKLKQIIQDSQHKIDQIINNTNLGLKIAQSGFQGQQKKSIQILLNNVLGIYFQTKTKTNKQVSQAKINQSFAQNFSKQQTKFDIHLNKYQKTSNFIEEVGSFDKFQSGIQSKSIMVKYQIQSRMGKQLGLTNVQIQNIKPLQTKIHCIQTSVLGIYEFIINFSTFIKNNHLKQFLTFINMPYGYSVQQRLKYMQGYDDDDSQFKISNYQKQNQILYGIQQVIRPTIFQQYYAKTIKPNFESGSNIQLSQAYQIHCRAIFDAINQTINKFRPYYYVNGCPYLWTVSEKALTFYLINIDCCDQMFDKVQAQVLRYASSLCGLLTQQDQPIYCKNQYMQIEQIFQKYTSETKIQLLQHRQQRITKQQKIDIKNTFYQWECYDEYKTALLYELSSSLLQDLAQEVAIFMMAGLDGLLEINQILNQFCKL